MACDDRGMHIECGVYLTNHSREVRSEKIMMNKCIDYSHVIREQVRKISFGLETGVAKTRSRSRSCYLKPGAGAGAGVAT